MWYVTGAILSMLAFAGAFTYFTRNRVNSTEDIFGASFLILVLTLMWPVTLPISLVLVGTIYLLKLFRKIAEGDFKLPSIVIKSDSDV